ncbi:MAG: DUF6265 family protein [Candidatus Acidiferrales bacterium]
MRQIKSIMDTPISSARRCASRKILRSAFPSAVRSALGAGLLLVALLGALPAEQAPDAGARTASTAAHSAGPAVASDSPAPLKATLADFAWLDGKWRGDWGPRLAEQVWTAPRAGAIEGLFRVAEGNKTLVVELVSLVEQPDTIELHLRHFTPSLEPWETSSPAVLKLTALDAKKAVFDNAVNGEPKRVIFRRLDADTYVAHSEIVPDKGEPEVIEIIYHRVK